MTPKKNDTMLKNVVNERGMIETKLPSVTAECENTIQTNEKVCSKCHLRKDLGDFHKSVSFKDGHKSRCKLCVREESVEYYSTHKETYKSYNKIWEANNREKRNADKNKRYPKYRLHYKEYRLKNRVRLNSYQRFLLCESINYRISSRLRTRVWSAVKNQSSNKSNHSADLLGCNMEEFKNYLESKFSEGMTWNNYGMWHIDHIKACATFDLSLPSEQIKCFHYTNLQPLWRMDNFIKGKR